jgi:hypothetical protein
MAGFTFKKDAKLTGLSRIGHIEGCDIKLNKKKIGRIEAPSYVTSYNKEFVWKIRFMVEEDNNENSIKWKWITLTKGFSNEQEAREFLKKYFEEIIDRYKLYLGD